MIPRKQYICSQLAIRMKASVPHSKPIYQLFTNNIRVSDYLFPDINKKTYQHAKQNKIPLCVTIFYLSFVQYNPQNALLASMRLINSRIDFLFVRFYQSQVITTKKRYYLPSFKQKSCFSIFHTRYYSTRLENKEVDESCFNSYFTLSSSEGTVLSRTPQFDPFRLVWRFVSIESLVVIPELVSDQTTPYGYTAQDAPKSILLLPLI